MLELMQRGSSVYAVYSIENNGGKPIRPDKVSINMINNNSDYKSSLAPISVDELNGRITSLLYDVTGRITLNDYAERNISQEELRTLLFSLIDAVEDLDEFMIDIRSILLEPESVYINEFDGSILLICLPIINKQVNSGLFDFFNRLVFTCHVLPPENGVNYFDKAYSVVKNENSFSLKNLRRALNVAEPVQESKPARSKGSSERPAPQKFNDQPNTYGYGPAQQKHDEKPAFKMPPEPQKNQEQPVIPHSPAPQKKAEKPHFENVPSDSSHGRKEPEKFPENPKGNAQQNGAIPQIPRGESIEMPVKTPTPQERIIQKQDQQGLAGQMQPKRRTHPQELMPQGQMHLRPRTPQQQAAQQAAVQQALKQQPDENKEANLSTPPVSETPAFPDPQPVIVNPPVKDDIQPVFDGKNPKLMNKLTGIMTEVNATPFVIGRQASTVNLCISISTIGRRHAEITSRTVNNGSIQKKIYFIRDNNSVNHTYLNGEMLEPNKEVPLFNNAVIRFHKEEYIFIM